MFWHNFKYAFRTLVKNRMLVFWTLVFPFILAMLFNLAFARLHDYDVFEAFDVAIVKDDAYEKELVFSNAMASLGEGDGRVFNLRDANKDEAEDLLDKEEIVGYVYVVDGAAHVKVKENGNNATVLAMTVEQVAQSSKMIEDIAQTNMAKATEPVDAMAIYQEAVKTVTGAEPNIKDDSHVMNMVSIEFYTLIAMACMQGAMLSVELMNRCLPNITNRGKRVAIAPTKKAIVIVSNLLAGYIMLFVSTMALILFMRFILGVEFGSNMLLIMLITAVGGLAATMMGMCLSIVLKTRENAKNIIVVTITMVGCLFAGMFGGQKMIFDEMLPFVNKISPVGQITDGFYALFYYDDPARYISDIVGLLIVAGVFLALSIRGLRRQRYDSI